MPEEEKFHLSITKRYILRENKVTDELINAIQSEEEADELLKHLRENKTDEEEEEDPTKRMNQVGGDDFKLPKPKPTNFNVNRSMDDHLKPARINNFLKTGVYEPGARLMRVFTDDYPEGRVI